MVFGLDEEQKIVASGVRQIFTPTSPIHSVDHFFGRRKVVKKIIEHLNTPGQHLLLFGDRGVGKSSLANVTTQLLIEKVMKVELFEKRCSTGDNFLTVFRKPLESVGVSIEEKSRKSTKKEGGNAGLDIKIAKAGVNSESSEVIEYTNTELTPSNVAEFLISKEALLYIDEADQLGPKDKAYLAETMKLLSDIRSPFKILVVGIAETAEDITLGHLSVERCLKETKLERMQTSEIRAIIENGSKECGYSFNNDIVDGIVEISAGFPHFAHLLALKCVEEAIIKGKDNIDGGIYLAALRDAVKDSEATLSRKYESAIRSATRKEMLQVVLYAAARLSTEIEFTAADWRAEIEDLTGESITTQKLSSYLSKLVSDEENRIIKRAGKKGVYRFNDPRMPSYIKIANRKLHFAGASIK